MKQDSAAEPPAVDYLPAPGRKRKSVPGVITHRGKVPARAQTFPAPQPRVILTPEQITASLECIAHNGSLREAARLAGCDETTLWRTLWREHREPYARARQMRALFSAEELHVINQEMRDGKLDPRVGQIISGNVQWLAERQDGQNWGKDQPPVVATPPPLDVAALAAELAELESKTGLIKRLGVQTVTTTTTTQLAVEVVQPEPK